MVHPGNSPQPQVSAEPLQCPFCGAKGQMVTHSEGSEATSFVVACDTYHCRCCARDGLPNLLDWKKTPEAAITQWNTRADGDTLRSQVEGMREALERQCDNMAFVVNHVSLPDVWYEKFKTETEQDRAALSKGQQG